jgi:hypothetical protein
VYGEDELAGAVAPQFDGICVTSNRVAEPGSWDPEDLRLGKRVRARWARGGRVGDAWDFSSQTGADTLWRAAELKRGLEPLISRCAAQPQDEGPGAQASLRSELATMKQMLEQLLKQAATGGASGSNGGASSSNGGGGSGDLGSAATGEPVEVTDGEPMDKPDTAPPGGALAASGTSGDAAAKDK